jgi:hypothetical protein
MSRETMIGHVLSSRLAGLDRRSVDADLCSPKLKAQEESNGG